MIATSQPLASAAGPEGPAGWRQRHRRRRHRCRSARGRRAVDDRHRRRPLRHRLRREDEDAPRAQRERALGIRRHAAGVREARSDSYAWNRRAVGDRARRRRRLVGAVVEVRHAVDGEGGGAGGRVREERLRGLGDHQRTMESQREEARGRSRDRGDIPAQRPSAATGRDLHEPASGGHARSRRQGRTRRVLQRRDRAGYRRGHEKARRPARRARFRRTQGRLGRSHFDHVPRVRGLRDAAQHAGLRRARDAQHPRGLRREGHGPQLAGSAARARRGETDRVRGSRRLRRRSGIRSCVGAEDADLERLRGAAPQGDRSAARR